VQGFPPVRHNVATDFQNAGPLNQKGDAAHSHIYDITGAAPKGNSMKNMSKLILMSGSALLFAAFCLGQMQAASVTTQKGEAMQRNASIACEMALKAGTRNALEEFLLNYPRANTACNATDLTDTLYPIPNPSVGGGGAGSPPSESTPTETPPEKHHRHHHHHDHHHHNGGHDHHHEHRHQNNGHSGSKHYEASPA
jgi:hypothetical protein